MPLHAQHSSISDQKYEIKEWKIKRPQRQNLTTKRMVKNAHKFKAGELKKVIN
jgi:hypothetical protein